tara:strand:+ start:422 stop:685 length:264 start_codon:yes stop_codon:yes gene_type:complete
MRIYILKIIYFSFPVNPLPYDPDTIDAIIILLAIAAYIFGYLLIIYIPIRFIHWLITKKPIVRWEKFFIGIALSLVFILLFFLQDFL